MNRETKQREAILRFVVGAGNHPTADMIYESVRKEIPNISKGTVYRNLKTLTDAGLIAELNLKGTVTRYEGKKKSHYHFRCERCGRVFDVDAPVDTGLDRRIAAKTGYIITHHQLEFRGLCKECAAESRTPG